MTFLTYKQQLDYLLRRGRSFSEIEARIDRTPLSDEDQSALWLCARSLKTSPPSALIWGRCLPRSRSGPSELNAWAFGVWLCRIALGLGCCSGPVLRLRTGCISDAHARLLIPASSL